MPLLSQISDISLLSSEGRNECGQYMPHDGSQLYINVTLTKHRDLLYCSVMLHGRPHGRATVQKFRSSWKEGKSGYIWKLCCNNYFLLIPITGKNKQLRHCHFRQCQFPRNIAHEMAVFPRNPRSSSIWSSRVTRQLDYKHTCLNVVSTNKLLVLILS